ncbi:hypothetical protein K443DRAFT_675795 [Laccaria amethystina LaAM-08-1]|uniref:Uncharacterized protein n=1 Tax=Laccaria amethystina LaAM-08-1 TaxID=1095629 RepID=A0A0C9WXT9_9AGAR|nr:hypothetical protein K443DRAFT_675795 [Laccaria amethystina LaAM-08-1]
MMLRFLTFFVLFICLYPSTLTSPAPLVDSSLTLERRTQPYFPDTPASCPICAKDYSNIQSCAEAAPVLANFSMVIFNPGAFISVIKCACLDTFQAVFPQCVDCFVKTGQDDVIICPDLPAVVSGMRKICAIESTLLGNVTATNNASAHATSTPTSSSTAGFLERKDGVTLGTSVAIIGVAFFMGCLGL